MEATAPDAGDKPRGFLTKVAKTIDKGHRWYLERDEPDAAGRWDDDHRRSMLRYVYERDGGRCGICTAEMKIKGAQIEHVVPKVFVLFDVGKGGKAEPGTQYKSRLHKIDNLQAAHTYCNKRKGNTPEVETDKHSCCPGSNRPGQRTDTWQSLAPTPRRGQGLAPERGVGPRDPCSMSLYDARMVYEAPNASEADPSRADPTPVRQDQGLHSREPTLFDPHPYAGEDPDSRHDPMDASQEFHDPIYGFVTYREREIQIIDHPAFQRLFKVYQLGQTHLVFRGAIHSRGQHSLGTVAALELLIDACRKTYDRQRFPQQHGAEVSQRWKLDRPLNLVEQWFARLAALIHDIGHVVNGHTLEDELGLLHNHASRQRLDLILDKSDWVRYATKIFEAGTESSQIATTKHDTIASGSLSDATFGSVEDTALSTAEPLRQRIDRLYEHLAKEADVWIRLPRPSFQTPDDENDGDELRQLSASEILVEIVVAKSDRHKLDINSTAPNNTAFRIPVIRDLVGNTVCADLIDYLERDWRHIGKPRHLDTRLLQYMEIVTDGRESKVVVNLRSNQDRRARPDVMSAILELLENRYHLWEVALLHRTKTSAVAMLERAIMEKAHTQD